MEERHDRQHPTVKGGWNELSKQIGLKSSISKFLTLLEMMQKYEKQTGNNI